MRKTVSKIKSYLKSHPQSLFFDEAYQMTSLKHAPEMADVIWEIKRAFEKGFAPERCIHGSSATYFLKDCEGRPLAVFKHAGYFHELAAYRLDYNHFAGVPATVITTLDHPAFEGRKTGSCQYFVHGGTAAVELNRSVYEKLSATSIRRMAALDIRLMNEDRHTSNILVVDQREAIPIDHGYIFPHDLGQVHLVWVEWEQAATHFTAFERNYIAQLDPMEDRRLLIEEMHMEEKLANRLYVATHLLIKAVERGNSAQTIGRMLARNRGARKEWSMFEHLIFNIKKRNPYNWTAFTRYVYEEIDKMLGLHEKINQQTYQSIHSGV